MGDNHRKSVIGPRDVPGGGDSIIELSKTQSSLEALCMKHRRVFPQWENPLMHFSFHVIPSGH